MRTPFLFKIFSLTAICALPACTKVEQPKEPDAEVLPAINLQELFNEFHKQYQAVAILSDVIEETSYEHGNGIVKAAEDTARLAHVRSSCVQATQDRNYLTLDFGRPQIPTCLDSGMLRGGQHRLIFLRNEPEGTLVDHIFNFLSDPRGSISGKANVSEDAERRNVKFEISRVDPNISKYKPLSLNIEYNTLKEFENENYKEISGLVSFSHKYPIEIEGNFAFGPYKVDIQSLTLTRQSPYPQQGNVFLNLENDRTVEFRFLTENDETSVQITFEGETKELILTPKPTPVIVEPPSLPDFTDETILPTPTEP